MPGRLNIWNGNWPVSHASCPIGHSVGISDGIWTRSRRSHKKCRVSRSTASERCASPGHFKFVSPRRHRRLSHETLPFLQPLPCCDHGQDSYEDEEAASSISMEQSPIGPATKRPSRLSGRVPATGPSSPGGGYRPSPGGGYRPSTGRGPI